MPSSKGSLPFTPQEKKQHGLEVASHDWRHIHALKARLTQYAVSLLAVQIRDSRKTYFDLREKFPELEELDANQIAEAIEEEFELT